MSLIKHLIEIIEIHLQNRKKNYITQIFTHFIYLPQLVTYRYCSLSQQTSYYMSNQTTPFKPSNFHNETNIKLSENLQTSILSDRSQTYKNQKQQQLKKNQSGVNLLKDYLLKKAQNMYKLNLTDEQAFKWKFNKNKSNKPLSSFRLIKKEEVPVVNNCNAPLIDDLMDYSFPVLAYKTKDLAGFAYEFISKNQYFLNTIQNEDFLKKLITQISLKYNIVSYHNFSHAFSLSLMLFQAFQYEPYLKQIYTQEQRFYAMLAGLAHDMNHPGTNNAFQVKTKSSRANQFNNQSVLQNFHLKQFWNLLQKNPQINFLKFSNISNAQQIKKRITYLILMTDVAQHFKNLQKLKALRSEAETNKQQVFSKQENKQFFLGQLFHASDIGNPCIDFQNYIKWAALLSYQFNQQTILQKQNNVEVTQMLKYKDLKTFYKGQMGFINYMVNPLWSEIKLICPNLAVFTNNIQDNLKQLAYKSENTSEEEENEVIKYK